MIGPDAAELRVLGALIEKQRTTPDAYPLSLNALRLATNQSTGRDPVVDYDEGTIRDAIARLVRRGWARLASGPGSRATKYRHLLDEALSLERPRARACSRVLMLRGAQTPGELRQRSERLHEFAAIDELEAVLDGARAAPADRSLRPASGPEGGALGSRRELRCGGRIDRRRPRTAGPAARRRARLGAGRRGGRCDGRARGPRRARSSASSRRCARLVAQLRAPAA